MDEPRTTIIIKFMEPNYMKRQFYPEVDKRNLFKDGYIASRSRHSSGSTVDLTIIRIDSGEELDMGTPFDYFGQEAHHAYTNLPTEVLANRKLLKETMASVGFKHITSEWWHYSYTQGSYPLSDMLWNCDDDQSK